MQFLARVVEREIRHLRATDARLFDRSFTVERAERLEDNPDEAERAEAFVARFNRLQDTVGDKLIPVFLVALGETPGAAVDNLDRAERLELLPSSEEWFAMRQLRNQMVHEYIEDPAVLASALEAGHAFVPTLTGTAERILAEGRRRGWLDDAE
ncbi:hypothetical protein [Thiohalospira sp.]|uniref:hypothetical protein n=1 Tax=Thiohalospira sp. TaxID=3080549 RepID=UPI003980B665